QGQRDLDGQVQGRQGLLPLGRLEEAQAGVQGHPAAGDARFVRRQSSERNENRPLRRLLSRRLSTAFIVALIPPARTKPVPNAAAAATGSLPRSFLLMSVASSIPARRSSTETARR